MENFLYKANKIKAHNRIVKLEAKNIKQQERFDKLSDKCKDLMSKYDTKYQEKLIKMNKKIEKLEKENAILKSENDSYKYIFEKVPKFILRIFVGKNKLKE